MFTSADLPEDGIRPDQILLGNIDTLKQSNSALKDLKMEDAVTDLAGLPLHDGD